MGTRPRPRPTRLAAKLLAIRQQLGLSQSELISQLSLNVTNARISEYESGAREPTLQTLLRYARKVKISVDVLIDDEAELRF